MSERTVVFQGLAYGASPATVQATANGVSIFSGTVTTQNQPVPSMPNPDLVSVALFTMTVDTAFSGTIPMTCEVTSGTIIFSVVRANYMLLANPIYSAEQIAILNNPSTTAEQRNAIYVAAPAVPPLSEADIALIQGPDTSADQYLAVLTAHNIQNTVNGGVDAFGLVSYADPRTNVYIDGILQNPDRPSGLTGAWWWTVGAGSTMSYDLTVQNNIWPPA